MNTNRIVEKAVNSLEKEVDSFDLLVTFKEDLEGVYSEIKGMNEIKLAMHNVKSYYVKETEFFNAVTLDLAIDDPAEVVHNLTKSSSESIQKAVPIDIVVPTTSDNIINATIEIAAMKIAKEESFTVKCELRSKFREPLNDVTNKVPCAVCRKLNLEYTIDTPDWVIQIEELGKNTGIAICRPDEILIN